MANHADLLQRRLSPGVVRLLDAASGVAESRDVQVYLVGGMVRDLLLGLEPVEPDLTVTESGVDFAEALAGEVAGEVVYRSQFHTAKVLVDETIVDVAMARTERYESPGALPEVEPAHIEDDLPRRDFSINAMAVSLNRESWGELLDPLGGEADVVNRTLRVLHDASFIDDPTRILRAVRYAGRLGFELGPETRRLLTRDLAHLSHVSGDRLRHELAFILGETNAVEALLDADRLGVLSAVDPALKADPEVLGRVDWRPAREPDLRLLGLLLFEVSDGEPAAAIERLRLDAESTKVVRDVGAVKSVLAELARPSLRPSEVYHLLEGRAPQAIEACAVAADDPPVESRLRSYLDELRHVEPALNGNDLLGLGVPQGPVVGELLRKLLDARLDGLIASEEEERALVVRSLESAGN